MQFKHRVYNTRQCAGFTMLTFTCLSHHFSVSMDELMSEVESMNSLLSHIEPHITSQSSGQGATSITAYLRGVKLISDDERLPQHIPDTVLIQHFVEFRIVLRGWVQYIALPLSADLMCACTTHVL